MAVLALLILCCSFPESYILNANVFFRISAVI